MPSRRSFLATGAAITGAISLPVSALRAAAGLQTLAAEVCDKTLNPILSWNNIPEYKSESPRRTSLLKPGTDFWGKVWPGSPEEAERLTLVGRVLTTRCQPISNARLEFWHTNSRGLYDYVGFNFRGLQNADKDGRYQLETTMPGYYSPRRHIHFLIGVLLDDDKSGILVANAIEMPTDDEFKTGKTGATIPPREFTRENGVLTAAYDLVIDVG